MAIDPKTITVFLDASPSGDRRAAQAAALRQALERASGRRPRRLQRRHAASVDGLRPQREGRSPASWRTSGGSTRPASAPRPKSATGSRRSAPNGASRRNFARSTAKDRRRRRSSVRCTPTCSSSGTRSRAACRTTMSAEQILLASGVPLLIIPNEWRGETHRRAHHDRLERQSGSAARRLRRDEPPGRAPDSVKALVVDPAGCKWLGEQMGCDYRPAPGRHGASGRWSRGRLARPSGRRGDPGRGQDERSRPARGAARASPAHLREILFGNATRKLLTKMPVPVLVSR